MCSREHLWGYPPGVAPRPRSPSTAKGVSKLPKSSFAHPGVRAYPIDTVKRFHNALARSAQKGTSGNPGQVIRAGLKAPNASVRAAARRARDRRK